MDKSQISLMSDQRSPLKRALLRRYLLGGSVLDVGCGNGLYGFDCESICSEIVQADIFGRRSTKAKKFDFIEVDAENIQMQGQKFDNVIAFDLVEHLSNDVFFLKKIKGILGKKGRIFLSVPNCDNSILEKINLAHVHFTDKSHRREYSKDELMRKLSDCGFRVLEILPNVNENIPMFCTILKKENIISRFAAKWINVQVIFFEKLGLFSNDVVADWLCVAEKRN